MHINSSSRLGLSVMSALVLCASWACDDGNTVQSSQAGNSQARPTQASCTYVNRFSSLGECKDYSGMGWSMQRAEADCLNEQDSLFSPDSCELDAFYGSCLINGSSALGTTIYFPGNERAKCGEMARGCEVFAAGTFTPSELCEGEADSQGENTSPIGGEVFQPMENLCTSSIDGVPGLSDDDQVCTWQSIGGCTEPGRKFADYASCEPVMTQRPFFPVPPSAFETAADDPIRSDSAFLTELSWVKEEAEACGCVCCHTTSVAPQGAAAFDTAAEGIWTDTFTERGLAIAAGWIDSTALGAHDANDNNGFDRSRTGLPTTDVDRMIRFFEGELLRRGVERDRFEGSTPVGGPLYTQLLYQPTACENNEGVRADGTIHWTGGGARYIYVLDAESESPSVPPNMDVPDGTLWKLDVAPTENAFESGIRYGEVPSGSKQAVPPQGAAPDLMVGETYYLYVLADIGSPITRCLFELNELDSSTSSTSTLVDTWAQICTHNDDCSGTSSYCALQPGNTEGYCTAHCASTLACQELGAPSDWTCNAVTCDVEAFTWCGPNAEIAASNNFLKVCE